MTKIGKARAEDAVTSRGLAGSPTHLLHRALQLALDLHSDAGGPAAITQRQYTVLAAAAVAEGQTQNDLVRATGIDRSTLADLVARMLAKGLLQRQRSATDARANTVRLSDAGRSVLGGSADAAAAADARLLAHLPGKKRDAFVKALATLCAAADGGVADLSDQAPKPAKVKRPKRRSKDKAARGSAAEPGRIKGEKKKKRKKSRDVGG